MVALAQPFPMTALAIGLVVYVIVRYPMLALLLLLFLAFGGR